jgi:hypothetical protein
MIVFIEPLGKPFAHLSVVKSMLFAELNDDLSSNEILFISSLDYFNSIPENFRNKLKFKEIKVSQSSILNIFEIVLIVLSAFLNNWKIKNIKVYLLFSKSYSNIILKFLSFFFLFKKKRLYVLLHGELQNIILKGSRSIRLDGRAQRMLYWLDTKFSSNLKFVIISEFVFEKLKKSLGYEPLNFVSIDLPYLYDYNKESTKRNTSELVVSTVGVNSTNKKSFLLNNIATNFENKIKSGALMICISGRNDDVLFSELIDTPNMGSRYLLSTEEYAKRINRSDVLVFFNDDNYSLISSGSYFDCINFEKPILAMKNEQWEYNFKQFGEIGYLCNNIDEMYGHINSLLNNNEYLNVFSRNLEIARDNTSIEKSIPYFMSKFQ